MDTGFLRFELSEMVYRLRRIQDILIKQLDEELFFGRELGFSMVNSMGGLITRARMSLEEVIKLLEEYENEVGKTREEG